MITLDESQLKAIQHIVDGHNILITASAGCGKTALVPFIVNYLTQNTKKFLITAMTGAAAILVAGRTLHSALGIGIKTDLESMIKNIKKTRKEHIWKNTDTLLIDEVSMLSKELFGLLDQLGRHFRRTDRPFGGIQIILIGDFCQLPPVKCKEFCFEHPDWSKNIQHVILLTNIYRQADKEFIECLNNVRLQAVTNKNIELLKSRLKKQISTDDIKPTILFPINIDVDKINNEELHKLPNSRLFDAKYNIVNKQFLTPAKKQYYIDQLDRVIENQIKLAVGAQVMLKINLDQSRALVNGSRGVVVGFDQYPIVKFLNGITTVINPHTWTLDYDDITISKIQIPLRLAYAMTIHCCQGATLDLVEIDIGNTIFEYGQVYTALSRVRDINGLSIKYFNPKKIKTHPNVLKFYNSL